MGRDYTDYRSFWATAEEGKSKGSGVGILVNKDWEKHIGKVSRFSSYYIDVLIMLKKGKIVIIVVYIPPNDKETKKQIQQQVIRKIRECERKRIRVILIGDFNDIRCRVLDQSNEYAKRARTLPLLAWLENSNLDDVFRRVYPTKREYTWSNKKSSTRIDYIWASEELSRSIIECEIISAEYITGSDHKIVQAKVVTGLSKKSRGNACNKRMKKKKRIIMLEKATEEDWENYRGKLDQKIRARLERDGLEPEQAARSWNMDELWDILSGNIIKAAYATLPNKEAKLGVCPVKKPSKSDSIQRDRRALGGLCHKCEVKEGQLIEEEDREMSNSKIRELNEKYEVAIKELEEEQWTDTRGSDLKAWWKILSTRARQERKKEDLKEIDKLVEIRCEAIQGELKHMLSSLLERSSNKIKLDRVLTEEQGSLVLHTEEKDVLEEVRSHFTKQFRKRRVDCNNLPSYWEEAYSPLREVDDRIYNSLSDEVSEEEWYIALKDVKAKSAPGVSGISYPLIKKAGKLAQKIFRVLASKCITEGDIPAKWKISQLYPIPKGSDWNYNLSNVRPIILLETFRKSVVRVMTKRLDKILVQHNVLKGPNYAGLSGNSTSSPIHIMNNIIEDAKEKGKELWILFQDMKKAFDSVSISMLKKALTRIKLPEITKNFLLSLYDSRKIKVITSYGLTQELEAGDGLDQGEVVSPLMWRIFYDPLLCTIQRSEELGYKMKLDWPKDLRYNVVATKIHHQGVLAFADDTTWLAESKEDLQEIINISEEFYSINDIEINGKKSELVVINSGHKKGVNQDLEIRVGKSKDSVKAKRGSEAVRHLGVWISEKGGEECNVKIITSEIVRMCKAIRWKKASASQLTYLNNSVLMPSIEYRLQTSFLTKAKCDRLQRPIWMLIKNKLELAKTTANSICSHTSLLGLRTIWQNQLAHHITELTIRLNKSDEVGITTQFRLKEAQIKYRSVYSLLNPSFKTRHFKLNKNLACSIVQEVRKLGFNFQETEANSSNLEISGTEIAGLLREKEYKNFCKSKNTNIYTVEQLIEEGGKDLLTWHQLLNLRGYRAKGRKPSWFQKLEERVLKNLNEREVHEEFKIKSPNCNAIKAKKQSISPDKRKKEWALVRRKGETTLGKVAGKMEKTIILIHWQYVSQNSSSSPKFIKCKGCNLGRKNGADCIINHFWKSWHQVVEIGQRNDNMLNLKYPVSAYTDSRYPIESGEVTTEQDNMQLEVQDLEEAIIQRLIEDKEVQEDLKEIAKKLKGREELDVYTDGSMARGESANNRMGIGWVVVEKENSIDRLSFSSRILDWPSSTRAELGAIWTAILAVPYKARVNIYTDSQAAIEGIQNKEPATSLRAMFKMKNRCLIRQIKDSCKAKNITLKLKKVKGHSGNKWNDIADELAKAGISSRKTIKTPDVVTDNMRVLPSWNKSLIDFPLRSFVNLTMAVNYETKWGSLSKIKEATNRRQGSSSNKELNWRSMWEALKTVQGKKCISMKRSKALMFRIKCINKLLPTKDICYQRNPKIYKSETCIACYAAKETFDHLAECIVYQGIWKSLEEKIVIELNLEILERWDLSIALGDLKKAILGEDQTERLEKRKLLLRGLSDKSLIAEMKSILGSKTKATKSITDFICLFWSNLYEGFWKFRCEAMAEWEKDRGIDILKKKEKKIRQSRSPRTKKRIQVDKENTPPVGSQEGRKRPNCEEEAAVQEDAVKKVKRWIEGGKKEEWIKFKTT